MIPKSRRKVHCVQCNRSYADWQYNAIFSNRVCVGCGEPIIFKEEVKETDGMIQVIAN